MRSFSPVLALLALAACGSPPGTPSVELGPEGARTGDDLIVTVNNPDSELSYSYSWSRDGALVSEITGDTVLSEHTAKGEVWEVAVAPSEGRRTGTPATARITIANTPPSVTLEWAQEPTTSEDDLRIIATPFDIDGDQVQLRYRWTVDGGPLPFNTDTIEAIRTVRGQIWEVTVTPSDSQDDGEPAVASMTIFNNPPTIGSISIEPDPAFTEDTLLATAHDVEDLDDDEVTVSFEWFVNGTSVQVGTDDTLSGDFFNKDDTVRVIGTPNDTFVDGESVTSPDVPIVNSPPEAPPQPAITPVAPTEDDGLTCTLPGEAFDPDHDPLTYEIRWYLDGSLHSSTTGSELTSVISVSVTAPGQSWTCDAIATDDEGASSPPSEMSLTTRIRGDSDGEARRVDGSTIEVTYELCGSGTGGCNAAAARAACSAVGSRVVSHASDGTSTVYSLGASSSCNWSIGYYETFISMPSGACLVGISNLDWSDCCGRGSWHGNTVNFGTVGSVWGYVQSSSSGYDSGLPNVSGRTWGCNSESSAAPTHSGCTAHYVACTPE